MRCCVCILLVLSLLLTGQGSAQNATTDVHGVIAGVPVEYKTAYLDACKTAGLKYPLQSKSRNIYSAKLSIKSYYPSVRASSLDFLLAL